MPYRFGDWTIHYTDGTHEDVAQADLRMDEDFLDIGVNGSHRLVPASRVKEISEWDRFGFRRSAEAIFALPDEQIAEIYRSLSDAPIKVIGPEDEVPSSPAPASPS